MRTALQREANELDLQMFRLAVHLEAFATKLSAEDSYMADDVAAALRAARSIVRKKMHPDDREGTE